nr:hematopoietic prostaglandin D synthase isoform X3 [Microcebus murinus]
MNHVRELAGVAGSPGHESPDCSRGGEVHGPCWGPGARTWAVPVHSGPESTGTQRDALVSSQTLLEALYAHLGAAGLDSTRPPQTPDRRRSFTDEGGVSLGVRLAASLRGTEARGGEAVPAQPGPVAPLGSDSPLCPAAEPQVTWADFYWDICSTTLLVFKPDLLDIHPRLVTLQKKVQAIPAIASWIGQRPQTKL